MRASTSDDSITDHTAFIEEPNLESGANIDCCKLYRDNREEYEKIVRDLIREQLGL
jgi:ubiquitin-conjugating enzyme E2 G2